MGTPGVVEHEVARVVAGLPTCSRRGAGRHIRTSRSSMNARQTRCRPTAPTVHADLDVGVLERLRELDAGELASLVSIKDFRPAAFGDCLFERLDTEIRRHADRHSVRQNLVRCPVHDVQPRARFRSFGGLADGPR